MSWADDYFKLLEEEEKKKKKKKEEEKETATFETSPYSAMGRLAAASSPSEVLDRYTAQKTAEKLAALGSNEKWFQKGAFEDGYQFGDVLKSLAGTVTDARENIAAGVLGIGEKVVDAGAYLVGGAGKLFGADEFADKTKDFIAKDLYDENAIAKKIIGIDTWAQRKQLGVTSDDSVLGGKADSVLQSGGQLLGTAALGMVGIPGSLTIGVTSFGGEVESAFNNDATYGEAGLSGIITAGAEVLTEKISGGIKFGGKTLDDALTKRLARNISNKTVRTLTKLGMDMAGEGAEEILSGYMGAIGQKLTYMDDKELSELFSSEDAWDAFIGGVALGGFGSTSQAISSNVQGKDYVSGLTKNEQAVVDKVYEDAIKEAEKEKGEKLTSKEKDKIYDEVIDQMEKGAISIDTIEEILGGDDFKAYKEAMDSETMLTDELKALEDEYKPLNEKAHKTLGDADRITQIQRKYSETKAKIDDAERIGQRDSLKSKLGESVFELVKNDRLSESYNERSRRGQKFEADISKYDKKQQQTIQKAIDSGILNNTRRTHEFVDMVAKITADKGVLFDFTSNEKLKNSGFAVDGKQVNGFVTKDGITVNVNSVKSLNTVVGHEITHVLEGTELYNELQKAIVEYAKTKGDYQGRYDALSKLYENIEGANIDNELTADLVGDYLFTDQDFVNNLSVKNQNVFQKIWDEVKYLAKVATAGSKEARELAKVQRAFEKAYREAKKAQADTKYSVSDNNIKDVSTGYASGETYFTMSYEQDGKVVGTLEYGEYEGQPNVKMVEVNPEYRRKGIATKLLQELQKKYPDAEINFGMTTDDGTKLLDSITYDVTDEAVVADRQKLKDLQTELNELQEKLDVLYDTENLTEEQDAELHRLGDRWQEVYETIHELEQTLRGKRAKKTFVRYSVSDNAGKQLTKEQQEYFGEHGIKDENGNLLTLYRSADGGRTVWDGRGEGSWAKGIYLTDDVYVARAFAADGRKVGDVLEVYAKAENPFVIDAQGNGYMSIPLPEDAPAWLVDSADIYDELNADQLPISAFENGYDAVIIKNVREGVGGDPATDVILRDANQFKRTDNTHPTSDPDIRYSLSDSEGRKLSESQAKYFKDSKVTDENGNLKVVYHGSPADFNTFSLEYLGTNGTAEGYGFYFTDKKSIAENYSRGHEGQQNGASGKLFEVYLDIKKPLSDTEVTMSRAQFKKFLTTLNKQVDADGEPLDVLSNYGDVAWEGLNNVLNYAMEIEYDGSDSDVNLVHSIINGCGNMEVVLDVLRKTTGYDGIIVENATWGGDQKIYLAFHPEQIKNVDNLNPTSDPDIRKSLSEEGQAYKPGRGWNVRGEDIALAPVASSSESIASSSENIAPVTENAADVAENPADVEMFPDEQTPGVDELMAEAQDIMGAIEAYEAVGDRTRAEQLVPEYEAIMEKIGQMEQQERQRADSLMDADVPPEMEAPLHFKNANANLFADRDEVSVGDRKVKSFMSEHPEVTPFFQEMAGQISWDLADSVKAERWYNDQLHYESGGEKGFGGNSRMTSEQIAEMLDDWRMSYADIEKGINSIMEGKADNAAAKRVEIMLDRMLRNGYKDFHTGKMVEPNQDYIDTINGIEANAYSDGAFDDLVAHGDEYAPYVPGEVSKTETTTEAPVAEKYETIKPKAAKEPRMAKATPEEQAKTAKILFEREQSPKQKSAWKWAKEHIFRKGAVFEDLSLRTGNRELQAKFDMIRRAENKAQTFIGNGKGNAKALVDVRKAVEKAGKTEDFNYYLYHLHNADRMTLEQRFEDVPNKAVFGDAVTAEVSQKAATNLETLNPEFKQWAEEIYAINKHLRQMMVDEGIISQETADLWQEMYPHYVPISRADYEGLNVNVPLDTKRTGVNAPIKKAKGGNSDFYNVFDTMGTRIEQTFKAISKNRFGVELKNTLGTAFESEAADIDSVLESMDAHEELLQEGKNGESPTFTVFENGERVKFAITEDMYEAMKPSQFTYTNKVLKKVNDVRRDILTTYNPTFALTNPIKDVQDILLNSQHPARTYATIPEAIKSVLTKDQWYQERMENGGEQDSYFDGQAKTFKKEDGLFKKALGFVPSKIQAANEIIEQVPRMAEYIASRKMGRSVDVSMLDAARVTTNFGAAGDLTNMLNRNGFTFLGASVEGFNQQVRNVREAKAEGAKGVMKLAAKYLAAGLPAMLLNHLLWDDDEEYAELSDYVKQNYYVVAKTEDGKFIRIPKGRAVAVIQDAFQQMENLVTGNDDVDLESFAQLVINNLAPNNPLENNIIAPIDQALRNKTWYGDDLVPTRLQDMPAAEQFDETTDSFSKWLGEKTNTSPYKWNYLLDQYSGGIGDIALPYLTPEADGGGLGAAFRDKFVTDPVLKNQNVTDFYDKKDELTVNANSMYATDEDVLMNKYMSTVNSKLSELYQQKREIQNDSSLSDEEKYAAIREIQSQIVDITREGLASYEDISIDGVYATVGDQHFRQDKNGQWQKLTDKQLEKQEEVTSGLGIQPSEYWSNKEEYDFQYEYPEKYDFLTESGIGYDTYVAADEDGKRAYTWAYENPGMYTMSKAVADDFLTFYQYRGELFDLEGEKDENGKTISGTKKAAVIDYINGMDLDYGQKIILLRSMYDSKADRENYNADIVEYLNSRDDISYEEMVTILEELGMKVNGNNVTWD